jgi:dihydrofolate synthase/folylpolyglutamate synthase
MVVGILEDKSWKAMLRELSSVADLMILTRPFYERAADPHQLASPAHLFKKDPVVIPHLPEALAFALNEATSQDTVCITGSLYTVGDAKACLQDPHAPG